MRFGWLTPALSPSGERDAARPKIERSLAQNPKNPWAAHARAHLCYEAGDPQAGRAFLVSWLPRYTAAGALYSHLSSSGRTRCCAAPHVWRFNTGRRIRLAAL